MSHIRKICQNSLTNPANNDILIATAYSVRLLYPDMYIVLYRKENLRECLRNRES